MDYIFQALSDPTRRSNLKKIAKRERAVGEIAEIYSMSLAAISKHIQSLERVHLITGRREGSYSYVKLNPEAKNRDPHTTSQSNAIYQGKVFAENAPK